MHANLFSRLDTKYAYSLWQEIKLENFLLPPPLFPTKSVDFMLLIDIRNVLQSNEFVWNQSHIPNIMHPVSIHSNKHVLCAILNHYINEIKWILAKVFGTFRDIVISSVIKPRPFWVFWWLRFFHIHIQTRRLVFVLNKSNKRKKLYPDITSYINYQVIKYTYHSFENRIFLFVQWVKWIVLK